MGVILSGANHSSIVICEAEGSAVVLAVTLSDIQQGTTSLNSRQATAPPSQASHLQEKNLAGSLNGHRSMC
jgi:hypothetical protein